MDGSYICTKDKRKGSWGGPPSPVSKPLFSLFEKKKITNYLPHQNFKHILCSEKIISKED